MCTRRTLARCGRAGIRRVAGRRAAVLLDLLEDGDLVLTMGAGDIGAYAAGLPESDPQRPRLEGAAMMAAARDLTVQGELRYDEPMSRHTSWRAGGPADVFFVPASIEDLSDFLAELDADTPVFWHGVGSNLLVRDGGIRVS